MGFLDIAESETHPLLDEIGDGRLTPGIVLSILENIGKDCDLIITLDEFDRLPKGDVQQLVADLIKSVSDNNSPATVFLAVQRVCIASHCLERVCNRKQLEGLQVVCNPICRVTRHFRMSPRFPRRKTRAVLLVGVGDSITELVKGHESVGRHIVEVPLPRMKRIDLEKIVEARLPQLGLTIEPDALEFISLPCTGLPYYMHLLAQHAACAAIQGNSSMVSKEHVDTAMKRAIDDSEREMKTAYYQATHSRQPNTLFAKTLAACALAKHDEFGYFTAASIRQPLSQIRGTEIDIPSFSSHLERFTKKEKGAILQQTGQKHQRKYRFRDPLMQPFIIIRSLDDKTISVQEIKAS